MTQGVRHRCKRQVWGTHRGVRQTGETLTRCETGVTDKCETGVGHRQGGTDRCGTGVRDVRPRCETDTGVGQTGVRHRGEMQRCEAWTGL